MGKRRQAPRHSNARAQERTAGDLGKSGVPARWGLNRAALFVVIAGLLGLGIFMYPSTAAWWSAYDQSKAIDAYSQAVRADAPPGNLVALARAHEYNDELSAGGITIGSEANVPTLEDKDDTRLDYWDLLRTPGGTMARLKIPSIKVDLPVYHGTSDKVLDKGVGHLEGTSLPVGGEDTHSVLTAHTGLATATLFNDLNKVKLGETFTIEVFGEVLTYQVTETQTVLPDQTEAIQLETGADLVTLVTCTPLGVNTHRYLVTGQRIEPTPLPDLEAAGKAPEVPRFPWWAVILPGGVALAGFYLWRSGYPPKPKSKGKPAEVSGTEATKVS